MPVCLHGLFSLFDYVALHMFGVEGCVRAGLRRACPRRVGRARVVCRVGVALPRAWPHRRPLQAALGWDLLCRALVARVVHADAEAWEAADTSEVVAEAAASRRKGSLSLAEAAAAKSSARSMPALPALPEL